MSASPLLRRSDGGHAMAQLAACRRAVGVTTVDRLTLLELRGSRADLAAVRSMLTGMARRPGEPERLASGWWQGDPPFRALILEDPANRGQLRPLRDSLARRHPDVAVIDASDVHLGLVLAGPRARSAAARWTSAAMIAYDGEQYAVLVLRRRPDVDAREVALDVGRANGAVLIAPQTAELHRAAGRTGVGPVSACTLPSFIDTNTTGVRDS